MQAVSDPDSEHLARLEAWMTRLTGPQVWVVTYMLSRGYVDGRVMPRSELRVLARRFGRAEKTVGDWIRALLSLGLLREYHTPADEVAYSVVSSWQPATRPRNPMSRPARSPRKE